MIIVGCGINLQLWFKLRTIRLGRATTLLSGVEWLHIVGTMADPRLNLDPPVPLGPINLCRKDMMRMQTLSRFLSIGVLKVKP